MKEFKKLWGKHPFLIALLIGAGFPWSGLIIILLLIFENETP